MRLADIEVGKRYEVDIDYTTSYTTSNPSMQKGRYEAEVVELRVHRTIRRDGWYQKSKKPDGVLVEILIDGEGFPNNQVAINPARIRRPWEERQAEDQVRWEAERKRARFREIEKARAANANGILTEILGKVDPNDTSMFDRRLERVFMRTNEYNQEPSKGTVFIRTVDELERLANLAMMGLQHERDCLRKGQDDD